MVEKNLNALLIIAISLVLFGAFSFQIFFNEQPCPLCFLQRCGMFGVMMGAFLNLKFGISPRHYGVSLIGAITGGFTSLRQIGLNACPSAKPYFGEPFLGLSLYTWALIVFASSVAFIALMGLIFNTREQKPTPTNWWCELAGIVLLIAALGNIISSYLLCGFGPCEG